MINLPTYIHLEPGGAPPELSVLSPFRAVVVIDAEVSTTWQALVSAWLVRSGCLYLMAWGDGCSYWDDSVDMANIEQFDYADIPEASFVMTTWHDNEPLAEALRFCKDHALHSRVELHHTGLLHIATRSAQEEMLRAYADA